MAQMISESVSDSSAGMSTLEALDRRIARIIRDFKVTPLWVALTEPGTPSEMVSAIIREVYWEIHCYQPCTTKAGFTMLGRITPEEHKMMRTLLLHKWDEVEHRVWALDGYKAFGGDLDRIESESGGMSPGAFAVAAVWDRLACSIHPLAYLGAEYLFEDLTAHLAKDTVEALRNRTLPREGMRFIADHAEEDAKHSALLKRAICEVVERKPFLRPQMLYAFDCFSHVYPLPLWQGAYERALQVASLRRNPATTVATT